MILMLGLEVYGEEEVYEKVAIMHSSGVRVRS